MSNEATRLRDIVRAKDPMHDLCKERLITPEACDWVKYALDPFHDLELENLRGYPDVATEPTVVVKVRQAMTVAAPPGLPAGTTWDCHMVLSPVDFAPRSSNYGARVQPFGPMDAAGTHFYETTAGLIQSATPAYSVPRVDGLLVNSVPSTATNDQNMTFTPGHMPINAANGYECQNLNLDQYLDWNETDLGVYRVVYSGFEVVNTTAQIYKQGAVTVYEYGNSFETASSMPGRNALTAAGTTTYNQVTGQYNPTNYFRSPPNTLAEAKIMPGSHSWAAQDGCYNTAKFQSENPFQAVAKRPYVIAQNRVTAGTQSGYTQSQAVTGGGPMDAHSAGSIISEWPMAELSFSDATAGGLAGPAHFSRMNTSGAYFTGLSKETTLFVTWRVGVERLPAANKPSFLALAQPSATFDPNALVLYNMVANVLPPGCPQGYNDAGKWFNWITSAAKKAIPTVYPIVRTAAMLADSMGRPVMAGSLHALQAALKPVAEGQAVKRLQQAARAKQAQQQRQKPATQNWAKPSPRGGKRGGTNGLG